MAQRRIMELDKLYQLLDANGGMTITEITAHLDYGRNALRYWLTRLTKKQLLTMRHVPTATNIANSYSIAEGVTIEQFMAAKERRKHHSELWNRLPTMTNAEFEALVWSWADERMRDMQNEDDARTDGTRVRDNTAGHAYWLGTGER